MHTESYQQERMQKLSLATLINNYSEIMSFLNNQHIPCKIGTGISPRSRQDSRRSLGSRRDPAEVAHFPGGILPGKNSCRVCRQESRREICTRRDPAKKKNSSPGSRRESCLEGKS